MKKNVIVLLLIVIMASCSIGTVPVMAAEIEAGDVVDSGTCGETAAWTLTGTRNKAIRRASDNKKRECRFLHSLFHRGDNQI